MRFFKNRPLLAVLIVVGLVGAASGAVYAVDRVFLSIDPDKSAPESEQDVKDQLGQAGVTGEVHAEKTGSGQLSVEIKTTDPRVGSGGLDIELPTGIGDMQQRKERVEVRTRLTDAQQKQLGDALGEESFAEQLARDTVAGHPDDADAYKQQLAKHGFHDVSVELVDDVIDIKVNAPPN